MSAPAGAPAPPDPRLADQLEAAVRGCSDVVRLSAGPVATYLSGRIVPGVAVHADAVIVAVVARYGTPLPAVAEQVREAVRQVRPEARVDVAIDDVELPAGPTGDPGRQG